MAILPSVQDKMLSEETDFESPISETLLQKIGSNVNSNIDDVNDHETRITSLETANTNTSTPNSFLGVSSGETTLFSLSNTASNSGVNYISFGGRLTNDFVISAGTATIRIKRGVTTLQTITLTSNSNTGQVDFIINYLDTGAGTGAVTYNITGQTDANSIITYNGQFNVFEVK